MTVITKDIGRADFQLHRYADERIGVLWQESLDNGDTNDNKDLSGWIATLTLESDLGETLVEVECTCTSDGYTIADIPYSVMSSEILKPYTFGRWRIVGTDGMKTEVIGAGNFEIV